MCADDVNLVFPRCARIPLSVETSERFLSVDEQLFFHFHLPKENVHWSLHSMGFFHTSDRKYKINLIRTLNYLSLSANLLIIINEIFIQDNPSVQSIVINGVLLTKN